MRCLIILFALLMLSGCSIQPWVKPYEREYLADPTMVLVREGLSDKHLQHVYETREGARGAGSAQGGGCGCN